MQLTSAPHRPAQGAPVIDAMADMRRHRTARRDRFHRKVDPRQHALGRGDLVRRHLFEVQPTQPLFSRHSKGRIDFDLGTVFLVAVIAFRLVPLHSVQQCLGGTFFPGLRHPFFLHATDGGQHHRHHVFHVARIAPVKPKHLSKHCAMLGPVHETGMQCPVEIFLAGESGGLDCADRIHHPPRPNWQTSLSERPGEMGDVVREFRVLGDV